MATLPAREAKDFQAKMRAAEAMQYRVMGHTYEWIAKKCGYNNTMAAYRAVNKYRESMTRDSVEAIVEFQADLILRAILRCEEILEGKNSLISYQERAMIQREQTNLLKRQSELLGMDKPTEAQKSAIPYQKHVTIHTADSEPEPSEAA
jgi:hypothetical protein